MENEHLSRNERINLAREQEALLSTTAMKGKYGPLFISSRWIDDLKCQSHESQIYRPSTQNWSP